MKAFVTNIKTLSAMLLAVVAMVACSSDDSIIEQSGNTTGKYTLTVKASKGVDTRALADNGTSIVATWTEGDVVNVYKNSSKIGELTAQSTGASTTLSGTLNEDVYVDDELTLEYGSNGNYATQDGTLAYIASNCDYATAAITVGSIVGTEILPAEEATFVNQQAIVKFSLKNKGTGSSVNASSLVVSVDGNGNDYTVNPADATNELYVAIPGFSEKSITLTATVNGNTKVYDKADVTFANGNYYDITVPLRPIGAINGVFTVFDGVALKKIYFSKGNLMYDGTNWKFHEHQWDMVYNDDIKTVSAYPMDHFCWGNVENPAFNGSDCVTGVSVLNGTNDWGYNNIINGGGANEWRSLSRTELGFMCRPDYRTNVTNLEPSNALFARAYLFSAVAGVILFPDGYQHPDGVTKPVHINSTSMDDDWDDNDYNESDWAKMEAAGAVFMPAAGMRKNAKVSHVGDEGHYWLNNLDAQDANKADYVIISDNSVSVQSQSTDYGFSVRLVKDVE